MTCNVDGTPRGCTGTPATCPSGYPGCPTGTTTETPVPESGACTAEDLTQAAAACAGGADTTGCTNFLATLSGNGAQSCALCLQPFVVPFSQVTGIALCAAPFVTASCNQATGCYANCESVTCSGCTASALASCQSQTSTGSCSSLAGGLTCLSAAENGAAAFCNPSSYTSFGTWLQGVGAQYCE